MELHASHPRLKQPPLSTVVGLGGAAILIAWVGFSGLVRFLGPPEAIPAKPGNEMTADWRSFSTLARADEAVTQNQDLIAKEMARRDGVPWVVAGAIMASMSAAGFPSSELERGSYAKSNEFLQLRVDIETFAAQTPQAAPYATSALNALNEGQFDFSRKQFEAGRVAALNFGKEGPRIQAKFLELAALLDHLQADYSAAAQKYEAAAQIMPVAQAREAWRLSMAQAGEYESQGDDFGQTPALVRAIEAYRGALKLASREKDELDWATTHYRLAAALKNLSARENPIPNLEAAVLSYRCALEGFSRPEDTMRRATVLNNLGAALTILGEQDNRDKDLDDAIAAYNQALGEIGDEQDAMRNTAIHANLGAALVARGQKLRVAKRLDEAAQNFRAALENFGRATTPVQWASAKINLGDVLRALGQRDGDEERLEESAQNFRSALENFSRDKTPLEWASANYNLGNVLALSATRSRDIVKMREAVECFRQAYDVFSSGGVNELAAKAKTSFDLAREQMSQLSVKPEKSATPSISLLLRGSR